jgi:hypothetical protein
MARTTQSGAAKRHARSTQSSGAASDGADQSSSLTRRQGIDRFAIGLASLFFVLNLLVVLNHAMWRDEWVCWLLGRFAPTLGVLLDQTLHSGRPMGWYVISWCVCKIGFYPVGLKVFHSLVSTTCIYLFARYSGFTRLQNFLFAFGYFPFYEYGTIMRDYAFEFMAVAVVCAVFTSARRRPIAFGVALALLFQTTAQGVVIGCALGATCVFDLIWKRKTLSAQVPIRPVLIGACVACISLAAACFAMKPAIDPAILGIVPRTDAVSVWIRDSVRHIWEALCPLRSYGNWNSNFLNPWPRLQVSLSIIFFTTMVLVVGRRATALFFFVLATMAMVGFLSCLPMLDSVRYSGHFFIITVIAFWIWHHDQDSLTHRFLADAPPAQWQGLARGFLTALLCAQFAAGAMASAQEQTTPFSGSREAADLIRRQAPPNVPVIGDREWAVAAVAGYLDRPIFMASRGEFGTYSKIAAKVYFDPLPKQELMADVDRFRLEQKSDVVLLVNYPLKLAKDGRIELLGTVTDSENIDEQFMIYLIHYR